MAARNVREIEERGNGGYNGKPDYRKPNCY